ncbi:hypothetical protein HK102_002072, partial [Quaeritorhiza haematococci]
MDPSTSNPDSEENDAPLTAVIEQDPLSNATSTAVESLNLVSAPCETEQQKSPKGNDGVIAEGLEKFRRFLEDQGLWKSEGSDADQSLSS